MRFFKSKPGKQILYEKYKNSQINETNVNEPIKKEVKEERVHINNKTITIAICSLASHMGSSYISFAVALYVKEKLKKKVCIVDIEATKDSENEKGIKIYSFANLYELYDFYDFIVLDCSTKNVLAPEIQNEVKRANKKIMLSLPDKKYEPPLATFIRSEEYISKWTFVFNLVPKSKRNDVYDLMEDYEFYCFSSFDNVRPDKETNRTLSDLMKH